MKTQHSEQLFSAAKAVIPGGVNSPVRAFKAVGGTPRFIQSAKGPIITDADGNDYIDYIGSWGPMILGHGDADVLNAVTQTAKQGLSYGAPTALEVEMAELICDLMPGMDKVRMVNSGTEACMTAIRLARGATGKNKIIKFEGCYHGHADYLLVKAGSGALTFGSPSSPGVPADTVANTLTAQYNNLETVQAIFEAYPDDIACVIIEPIPGNMSMLLPEPGFLEGLRTLCDQHQSLLIFDEVMTGFRVSKQGAQGLYPIQPDLTTMGKVIGGGMPVGAFGGRADIMDQLSPLGPVYQAGTLSGNPVGMAAGLATLKKIQQTPDFYQLLEEYTATLCKGIQAAADQAGIPLLTHHRAGMFGWFFTDQQSVSTFTDVQACNMKHFVQFFNGMLEHGIYLAPSAYEAGFVSITHNEDIITKTIQAATTVFAIIQ